MKQLRKETEALQRHFGRIYSTIDGKLDKYAVNTFLGLIIALTCHAFINYVKVTLNPDFIYKRYAVTSCKS